MSSPDSTYRRVLDAARRSFREHGYVGTKTRLVASAAGTSESGLFRYFENKYALLTAVYNEAWNTLNEHVATTLKTHGSQDDPREALVSVLLAYWSFYSVDPETSTFLIINTGNTDSLLVEHQREATISPENMKYVNAIDDLCRKASERGLLGEVSARAMAEGLLGLSEGVMLGWYLHDHGPAGRYPKKIDISEAETMLRKLLS